MANRTGPETEGSEAGRSPTSSLTAIPGALTPWLRAIAAAPPIRLGDLEPLAVGTVVAQAYEVLGVLGRGGMGVVYRAKDLRLSREVAIKVLHLRELASDEELWASFRREADATAKLNHPNVVRLYGAGAHAGRPYLVLECLQGQVLTRHIQNGPISIDEMLRLLIPVCSGIGHAHRMGIVHRDLKPENVFIEHDGQVKVLDFGLSGIFKLQSAPSVGQGTRDLLRTTIELAGTPAYMAPEQRQGRRTDAPCDVFAIGAIAYEMLTGRLWQDPWETRTTTREHRLRSVDREIRPLLSRCLSEDPRNRPGSAQELEQALVRSQVRRANVKARLRAWRGNRILGVAAMLGVSAHGPPATFSASVAVSRPAEIPSPVSYWRFEPEDLRDSWIHDASGERMGELRSFVFGDPVFERGVVGMAMSFSGSAFVELDSFPEIEEACSVSAWVKAIGPVPTAPYFNPSIFDLWSHFIQSRSFLVGNSSGVLGAGVSLDGEYERSLRVIEAASYPRNSWIHLVAIYDGEVLTLYKDGQLIGVARSASPGPIFRADDADQVRARIGRSHNAGDPATWDGLIDELVIWDVALEETHVRTLFERGRGGEPAISPNR